MSATEETSSAMPELPSMVRVRTRRIAPITIGTGVQVTIVLCLTLIVLAIVGMIGGA